MKNLTCNFALLFLIFISVVNYSCFKKRGCTDINANNFDSEAEKDDGSCKYDPSNQCWQQPSNKIKFTILDGPTTELPSKLSIFFKLDGSNGQSIANLKENSFSFFEQGQNDNCATIVSVSEADRKIKNSPQLFRYSTLLLLDLSGSVIDNDLNNLKQASIKFIESIIPDTLNSGFDMSIWWFDGNEPIFNLIPITDNRLSLIAAINTIDTNFTTDKTTNLYGAIVKAIIETKNIKNNLPPDLISSASLVLFTDGRDRAQRVTKDSAYTAVDNAPSNITFFAIGLGNEIRPEDLNKFGKDGYKLAGNLSDLVNQFQEVGKLVTDEAGSYYNFEYCSPIRVGSSELIIEVSFNNEKGYTLINYSGAGFTGGCAL